MSCNCKSEETGCLGALFNLFGFLGLMYLLTLGMQHLVYRIERLDKALNLPEPEFRWTIGGHDDSK